MMMKKLLLTGIAALFLATGAAHSDDPETEKGVRLWCHEHPDTAFCAEQQATKRVMPFKILPWFAKIEATAKAAGYSRFCICVGEEKDGSLFQYPTYCVRDISKIPSFCIFALEREKEFEAAFKKLLRGSQ
jgi:hypothetical protein